MSHTISNPRIDSTWMDGLADFLAQERGVEAVLLNPDERKVSLATLGEVNAAALRARLESVIRALDLQFGSGGFQTSAALGTPVPPAFPFGVRGLPGNDLIIEKPSCPTAPRLWQWREFAWPEADASAEESGGQWRLLAVQAAICGAFLLMGWLVDHLALASFPLWIGFYVISIVSGGWNAAQEAWAKLRQRRLDIHFLMLAVAGGAVAIGAWNEGALLLFLFSTSGALEHYALHRTHREISALTKAAPKMARVLLPDGSVENRAVSAIKLGDVLQVRPDELFAVDGSVLSGETAADESNLTGEAVPVVKQVGAAVYGGTLNLWGVVALKVEKLPSQSALQKIINLIQHAQHLRAPSERFTDRFGTPYTWLVLGITTAMFFIWWLALDVSPFRNDGDSSSAFYRSMTLLVVMSPCALALSIPSAILAAIAWGARHGILFRGGAAIEKLAEVDVVCMDKTGTLTEGALRVTTVESFPPGQEDEVVRIAVSLDSQSNHPVSRAITAYGKSRSVEPYAVADFARIAGAGLRGKINGRCCYVGRRELMEQEDFRHWLTQVPDTPLGYSEVWVLSPELVGRILLQDTIRVGTRSVLEKLHADGLRTIMLTGDRRSAAEEVARGLGLDEVRAGLHPEQKVEAIRDLTHEGRKVAMVGDGVNDAPSLAAAYVSVAMGARGSDAALEQSDVVLMQDKIEKLLSARTLSLKARKIIQQNLIISLGAIACMAVASLFSLVPLTLGVIAHEGSTVIVCLNSLRLLFGRDGTVLPSAP